ncbi:MAG TPA: hypothetical protein VF978_04980 [Gemmatimonadales bacterium]
MHRAVVLAALLAAGPSARPIAAQIATNRSALYLHPTDVADARAIWVNPAGLAVSYHASIHVDLTVRDPGPDGRLGQVTGGFSSRGLGFAYQRDVFAGRAVAHTYRLGLAGASKGLGAGVALAHYRGDGQATGWDLGVVYAARRYLTAGAVVANIGRPSVRGVQLPVTIVPAVTVTPLGPALALSAHAHVTTDSVLTYAFGARWSGRARVPVALLARLDTDGQLRRAAFAFGVAVGLRDVVGAVVTMSGDLGAVDAASLYGVVFRPLDR